MVLCGLEEVMDMAISKEILTQYSDLQQECREVVTYVTL